METFLAVAEERSFSRAAARLHRTQPAVSQAIAKLESELGEVLFERSSRDGTLTDAGEVLREYAAKLLNLRNDAATALTELRSLHRGRLNLAANEYTCLYLLPLLDEFRRQNPRIKLAVQRTLASRISDEVLMHSVELGVLSFRPDDAQVKSMVVYRDELAFVVNPRHALAGAGKVSIRQLGAQNFIAHNIPFAAAAEGDPVRSNATEDPVADGGKGTAVAGGDSSGLSKWAMAQRGCVGAGVDGAARVGERSPLCAGAGARVADPSASCVWCIGKDRQAYRMRRWRF